MNPSLPPHIIALMVLDAVLRAFALWRSARSGKKWWFVALFLVNSLGILPAVYLFLNRKPKASPPQDLTPTLTPNTPTPKLLAHNKSKKSKSTS